jgi:hypothetical protein
MDRTAMYYLFGKHVKADRLSNALDMLRSIGRVRMESRESEGAAPGRSGYCHELPSTSPGNQKSWDSSCEKSALSELSPVAGDFGPSDGCEKSALSEKSPPCPGSDSLLSRLQAGSKWLTAQHKAWLEGQGVSDERFSAALEAWDSLERILRQVFGYDGCIFGPDRRCPGEAHAICDFCAAKIF